MRINEATLSLIMEFEGLRLEAYRDIAGVWTIGYGHSELAPTPPTPHAGMVISREQAEEFLAADLEHFASRLRPMFTREATPNEFGAMLSLAFNIGLRAFGQSTCLSRFNAGDIEGAAEALTWWNKASGKVVKGLVRRREAERRLMLSETASRIAEVEEARPRARKRQSTTLQAAAAQVAAAIGGGAASVQMLEGEARMIALAVAGVVLAAALWIARERVRKWTDGVR